KSLNLTILYLFILTGLSSQVNGDCSMMISGIHRCYDMIDMKIPQTNLESFLSVPLDYIQSCGTFKQEEFLTCYSGLLDLCTEYQIVNPLMMDLLSIKSMMYGMCDNKNAYLRGLECGTNKSATFHGYLRNCFNNKYLALATDSVESGNWTGFCLNVDANYRCLQLIIKAFGCEKGFINIVREFVYSVQPRQCRDARNNAYRWLFVYGGWSSSEKTTPFLSLLLCSLYSVLMINEINK
ncbi:hypothetical protein FSP39_006596, partial [Pinctada imbricata]